jgi:hypothetical protein
MNKMTLRVGLREDRQEAVIELWLDEQPLGHIFLDPATLEKHIRDCAAHRAQMPDEVPRDLDPGSRLEGSVYDPIWRIPAQRHEGGRILALRHPGIGWLGFVIPEHEAKSLAEWLTKDLAAEVEAGKKKG